MIKNHDTFSWKSLLFVISLSGLLTACGGDDGGSKHSDPAPMSEDVSTKIVKAATAGKPHPLPILAASHLEETIQYLQSIVDQSASSTGTVAASNNSAIESKRIELKNLRQDFHNEFSSTESTKKTFTLSESTLRMIEARFDQIDALLQTVESASAAAERMQAAKSALRILQTMRAPTQPALDSGVNPTQPWRTDTPRSYEQQQASIRPPQYAMSRTPGNNVYASLGTTYLAAADPVPSDASTCGYNATDLGQGISGASNDAQATPEIQALAQSLGYSPVRIYQWVYNEIQFEPYYGSLKGAMGALYAKAGGPTDQASLLIALLRASNIPARYVKGTIQVFDPTPAADGGRIGRWVGAKSYAAAAKILSLGRFNVVPAATFPNGLQFDHVWVEACVPYGNYRGVTTDANGHRLADQSGERWIPLDPSFKDKRYNAPLSNPVTAFDYTTFMAARTNSLPHESYENQITKVLLPGQSVEDIPYKGTLIPLQLDVLPASTPYEVINFLNWDTGLTAETAVLPDKHRYKFNVGVVIQRCTSTACAWVNSLTNLSLVLPQTVLQRITLSFDGATSTDITALKNWRYDPTIPPPPAPCTINVLPTVKLDGVVQGAGTTPVKLCQLNNSLSLSVTLGELGTPVGAVTYSNISPVNLHALQGYAFQASDRLLQERTARFTSFVRDHSGGNPNGTPEESEGEFLHIALLKYMRYTTDAAKRVGELDGGSGWSGNHIGLTSGKSKVQYAFDVPFAVSKTGFLVDVIGAAYRTVDLVTGAQIYKTTLLSGYSSSNYESYTWQEVARTDAVSTVRGLQFAKENKIEVLVLTSANWSVAGDQNLCKNTASQCYKFTHNADATLNYPASFVTGTLAPMMSSGSGNTLTIPRSQIRYSNWVGGVWLVENPANQLDQFMIAGDYIGGNYSGGVMLPLADITQYLALLDSGYKSPFAAPTVLINPAIISSAALLPTAPVNNGPAANGKNQTTVLAGDPVNMLTGNMYHNERDISIKGRGGLPIVFERAYNSRSPKDGPLGFGWTHSFNHFIRFYGVEGGSAKLSWTDGTGGEKFFATTNHASGNLPCNDSVQIPNTAGTYVKFRRLSNCNYEVREKNGLTYTFEPIIAGTTDTGLKARLTQIRDRNGNVLSLSYNASCGNNLCAVTDGISRSLTFSYTGSHINTIQDWTSRKWQYGYDGSWNLTSFKNPLAVQNIQPPVSYAYYDALASVNLNHAMKSYTLPKGNGMSFEYYLNGKVFRHTTFVTGKANFVGETNSFTYNDFRREAVQTNERGYQRHFFFDPNGNPIKIVEENGAVHQYAYADTANPYSRTSETSPLGLVTLYGYDSNGNLTQTTLPRGVTIATTNYNAFNQPQLIRDARGNYTALIYDGNGNATDTIQLKRGITPSIPYTPSAAQIVNWTRQRYDAYGNLASMTRVRDFTNVVGYTLTLNYNSTALNAVSLSRAGDKDGNGSIDAADISPTIVYDSLGRPTTDIDADWRIVNKTYDATDRLIQVTDAAGQLREISYDANGNTASTALAAGAARDQIINGYDDSDRKSAVVDTGGNVGRYFYDAAGNLTNVTNADNYTVQLPYDAVNRPVQATDQAGRSVQTIRDIEGKPRFVTDPNGNTITYTYWDKSQDGRLKRTTSPVIQTFSQGRALEYGYDESGNATTVTEYPADGSAARTTLTFFDELNRPVRMVGPQYTDVLSGATLRPVTCNVYNNVGFLTEVWAGSTTDTTSVTCNFGDANLKKQITNLFDDFGRKLKETDPLGKFWAWSYDVNNNVTTQTDANSVQTIFGYSTDGRFLLTKTAGTGASQQKITYTPNIFGQVDQVQSPEVTYTYSYDSAHRLKTAKDGRAGKTLTYSWSSGGLLNRLNDSDNGLTVYQYDATGRLNTLVALKGDKVHFNYDAGGRLIERQIVTAGGRLAADARYQYNADNSLKQISNRANNALLTQHLYTYDGIGNRTGQSEKIGGTITNYEYAYDSLNRLLQVIPSAAGTFVVR